MVVAPGNPVIGQQVEDGARRRVVHQVVRRVVDQAMRGAGDQEAAVGKGRAEAGAEPVVGQWERLGKSVVERQVVLGPVAHGGPGGLRREVGLLAGARPGLRLHPLGAGDEPIAGATTPLVVARGPVLRRNAFALGGGRQVKRPDGLAALTGTGWPGFAAGPGRVSLT